jgi:outer membrane protein OmpA-like peptidoglycan-associated protein
MVPNHVTELANDLRGDALNKVASALGETPAKIQTALTGVLPALFAGLANKASTSEGANQLLDLIQRNKFQAGQFSDVSKMVSSPDAITNLMNVGRPLLDSVFGGRANSVMEWVSSFAGVSRSSASSLLSLGLPMVLGLISRRSGPSGASAPSLMELSSSQRSFLQGAPAGLAGALGLSEVAGERPFVGAYEKTKLEPVPGARVVGTYDEGKPAAASSWWKWALPLLALVALLGYFFFVRRPDNSQDARAKTSEASSTAIASTAIANLGAFVPKSLPDGVSLNIPTNGVESRLVAFIEDHSRPVDKDSWFSFDRLEFETGSAELKPSSQEQLRNVAEILKAYPQVKVKIGGYTDNVGDRASNMKLSADRANNTMNAIANLGIDKTRLEAEGYGEQYPVADNATEEGRQRNRRIDIRVTQK